MKTPTRNLRIPRCHNMTLVSGNLLKLKNNLPETDNNTRTKSIPGNLVKIFLLVLFLNLFGIASATNYYFSATGNDGAAGTSPATAWQTITKFNSFFSSLQPGDSVLFKRGETFSGAMNISRSGSSSSPIIIGAYGSGAKPVITALASVSGWTNSGNIWTSNNAVSTLSRVNIVVISNVNVPMGRWPNTGYRTINSHIGNYSITDNSLTASPNWTGAEVVIRRDRWTIDRSSITSHSGNTINYSATGYDAIDGFGYFVQGSASALDAQNEWYYNGSTKKIQVYSTSSPTNVLVSTIDNLVSMSGRSYITFDNLSFQGANNNTFQVSGGNNINIKYCDIDYSGYNGINTSASPTVVQYSTINHSNNNGIYAGGTNNITVSNNTISNSGFIAGAGGNQADCYIGVLATGSNVLIEYNQVINTGYNGIEFNGQSTIVRNNFLNTFCVFKDDGAGIYTWNDGGNPTNYTGRKIQNNIIINGVGAGEGTDQPGQGLAEGIYLDDNAANVDITGNSVANCGDNGLFIHNAHEVLIRNNTFYNNTNQINLTQDNIPANPSPIANLTIRNNTLFARNSSQWVLSVANRTSSGVSFGSYDSNYYTRPINEASNITACQSGSCGSFPWPIYNLSGWQTTSRQDAHTNRAPITITNMSDLRFEYNETTSNKTIPLGANYIDVRNVAYRGSITLAPYTSAILIKTLATLPIHDVALNGTTDNNKHNLSWHITADEPVKTIVIETSADGSNFDALTTVIPTAERYTYQPFKNTTIFYRLKVTSVLDQTIYSNIIALKTTGIAERSFNVSTLVQNEITVNAAINYRYVLNDLNGKIIATGNGMKGLNKINISNQSNGMYFIQLFGIDPNTGRVTPEETQKIVKH